MDRRNVIKSLGLLPFVNPEALDNCIPKECVFNDPNADIKVAKKQTAIVCGAGARGNTYGGYALKYPEELDIVGVAEPIPFRLNKFSLVEYIILFTCLLSY